LNLHRVEAVESGTIRAAGTAAADDCGLGNKQIFQKSDIFQTISYLLRCASDAWS